MIIKILRKQKGFAQIDNGVLQNTKLSFKARGVVAYLLSMPETWVPQITELVRQGQEGRTSIQAAMKELAQEGYAWMEYDWDKKTKRLIGRHWVISESPREQSSRKPVSQETCPTGNPADIKTHKNKDTCPAEPGEFSLGLNTRNRKAVIYTRKFAEFTIKNRWHLRQVGSTLSGWKDKTLRQWERHAQELIQQENPQEVKQVMLWYFEHFKDPYVPQCRTLKKFCERFVDIKAAIRRINKANGIPQGHLRRKKEWHNGKLLEVNEWVEE